MSCPLDTILDGNTQKSIDSGVAFISEKISTVRKTFDVPASAPKNSKDNPYAACFAGKLNRNILWGNILLQVAVLAFLAIIAATKGEKAWSVDALTWISWISMVLLLIQYRDAVVSGFKVFLFGVGRQTQVIAALTLAIAVMTKLLYDREGWVVSAVALLIFASTSVRVGLQIRSALGQESVVPIFLDFINRLVTVDRVNKIKAAFA